MCNKREETFLKMKVILVIGQEAHIGERVLSLLSQEPTYYTIFTAFPADAVHIAADLQISLFLIDEHLAHMEGLDLYDRLHSMKGQQETPAILLCSSLDRYETELKERDIAEMQKPLDATTLTDLVASTLAFSHSSKNGR